MVSRLRSLAISLALLVQCVSALPSQPLTRAHLKRPEGRRVVASFQHGLALLGATPEASDVEDGLLRWTRGAIYARAAFLAPFQPLLQLAMLDQRWVLFASTDRRAYRLHVDVQAADRSWTSLYRAGESSGALAARLRYRRIRALYNPSPRRGPPQAYFELARWLAQSTLAAHPEYRAVRMRMERLRVGAPGQPPRTAGFAYSVTHAR